MNSVYKCETESQADANFEKGWVQNSPAGVMLGVSSAGKTCGNLKQISFRITARAQANRVFCKKTNASDRNNNIIM